MVFVIEEYCDYDSGGMHVDEFKTDKDAQMFLQEKIKGMTEADAQRYLRSVYIIQGSRLDPTTKEVIKEVQVEL